MLGIGVSIGLAEIILISVVSLATALTAIATAHLIRRYWLHQKPHAGDVPPDFNLKLIGGSEDRVRISSFKEAETRRFDFRQLYLTPFPCSG